MLFEPIQTVHRGGLEWRDPAAIDVMKWHGIQVIPAFPTLPGHGDQLGLREDGEVLHDPEPGLVEALSKLPGRLRAGPKEVEEGAAGWIGQGAPDPV